MKIALLTNIISPHQLPLSQALIKRIGNENYHYVYTETHAERESMGWGTKIADILCHRRTKKSTELLDVDVLLSGNRDIKLFEQRRSMGKLTFYTSERWFKPPLGMFRLLVPSYLKMAVKLIRCATAESFLYLPIGVHAARDMLRLQGLFRGDLRYLFRAPIVAFESKPGGIIVSLETAISAGVLDKDAIHFAKRHGFVQIPKKNWGICIPTGLYAQSRMWGYFVAPKHGRQRVSSVKQSPKILWVGRMLRLKRVDVLIRACNLLKRRGDVRLNLYGQGPAEAHLRNIAAGAENIRFHNFVSVEQVRELMRDHTVYVLPSNGYEGWGAVVSEALEEGMLVFATVDSGAGATILPPSHLFCTGDAKRLAKLLTSDVPTTSINLWTAEYAAEALLALIKEKQ